MKNINNAPGEIYRHPSRNLGNKRTKRFAKNDAKGLFSMLMSFTFSRNSARTSPAAATFSVGLGKISGFCSNTTRTLAAENITKKQDYDHESNSELLK